MKSVFTGIETFDLRFPTSAHFYGSDAANPNPDYSAAYLALHTNAGDGLAGHGFAFTLGRGNDVQVAAIRALAPLVVGQPVAETLATMGALSRRLRGDSQLRWLGPDKGVMQMAIAAVTNALWDLRAKRAGKPLWKLLADLAPEEIVALVDFHHLTDAIDAGEALAMLSRNAVGKRSREAELAKNGYPAYLTSAGWLGYDDDQLAQRCANAAAHGWRSIKIKVGRNLDEDVRRCAIARAAIGPSRRLMVDANQRWSIDEAIGAVRRLAGFDLWWIEEPTHPDDILGHARIAHEIAPLRVAVGEHVSNAVVFKQFFQSKALGFCQIDACRSGGVSDVIATLLLAAKYGIPVCPHAGGVGLCELVQHLAIFDYIAIGASLEGRLIEYVEHLHEHFVDPVVILGDRYALPTAPGFSCEIREESVRRYRFPAGAVWSDGAIAR